MVPDCSLVTKRTEDEETRVITEIQCIRDIILNDNNDSKTELGVNVDSIHVYGAVLFSCRYHNKKVPTLELRFVVELAKTNMFAAANVSDATVAMGLINNHELDVMDLDLLKQDVALLWAYWGIIQAGNEYEKIARLCPIFVDKFLESFRVNDIQFIKHTSEDADWLHLPGMKKATPSTPHLFAIDISRWKDTYMERLREDISKANDALQLLGECSSLVCDTKQLEESKEKNRKLLERVNGDSQEHEFLLHMLHDYYDDEVNKLHEFMGGYEWAQVLQMVLTIERRQQCCFASHKSACPPTSGAC